MKRLLSALLLLLGLPACGLFFDDVCGGGPPYFDVEGVQLSVSRLAVRNQYRTTYIRFQLDERYYSLRRAGVGAAFACSPTRFGYRGTKERLDSLVFTSRYEYDQQHPAGTPLNDILRSRYSGADSLVAVQGGGKQPPRQLDLQFSVPPARTGIQQFIVRYRQTNGELYSAQSDTITIHR